MKVNHHNAGFNMKHGKKSYVTVLNIFMGVLVLAVFTLLAACPADSGGGTQTVTATYNSITSTINQPISTVSPAPSISGWTGTYTISGTPASLPTGLTLDENTGNIDGTPTTLTTTTTYTISMTGTGDSLNVNGTATIEITVINKTITSVVYLPVTALANKAIANPQTPTVEPTGATVSYALSDGVTLPIGLILDTDGSITGTPTAEQTAADYAITVTGTGDYEGSVMETKVNITVNPEPDISATYTDIEVTVGTAITDQTPASIDPSTATATYALADGETLPAGLSLATDGTISGTPTAVTAKNVYNIVLTGTEANAGQSGTAQVYITVSPKSITSVTYGTTITGTVGTAITAIPPTTDPAGLTATYTSDALVAYGLSLNENTGEITGTPTIIVASMETVQITVTGTGDWLGETTTAPLSIGPIAKDIAITGFSLTPASSDVDTLLGEGGSTTVSINADELGADDYSLSIAGPNGPVDAVTIDKNGNVTIATSLTKSDEGQYTVTATGKNNYLGTVSNQFNIWANTKPVTNGIVFRVETVGNNDSQSPELLMKLFVIQSIDTQDKGSYRGQDSTYDDYKFNIYYGNTVDFTPNGNNKRILTSQDAISDQTKNLQTGFKIGTDLTTDTWYYFKISVENDVGEGAIQYNSLSAFKVLNASGSYRLYAGVGGATQLQLEYGQQDYSLNDNWYFSNGNMDILGTVPDTLSTDTGVSVYTGNVQYNALIKPINGDVREIILYPPKTYVVYVQPKDTGADITYGSIIKVSIHKPLSLVTGFSIDVTPKTLASGVGGTAQVVVQNAGLKPGTHYILSIGSLPVYILEAVDGLSITNDGTITIDASVPTGTYTIRASGLERYTGKVDATITLTVQ